MNGRSPYSPEGKAEREIALAKMRERFANQPKPPKVCVDCGGPRSRESKSRCSRCFAVHAEEKRIERAKEKELVFVPTPEKPPEPVVEVVVPVVEVVTEELRPRVQWQPVEEREPRVNLFENLR